MISYEPFWSTLGASSETTYTLIHRFGISSNTINRLRKGDAITTVTLNDLCKILNCQVYDILKYEPSKEDQRL